VNGTVATLYARQERGRLIAETSKVVQKTDALWLVPSQSRPGHYLVDIAELSCTCPDHAETHGLCKHLHAVTFTRVMSTTKRDGSTVTSEESVRLTYSQDWHAYNLAQTTEKAHFQSLLRGLCDGVVSPPQASGRPRLALSDVVYGATMKVYTTVSGRRATTDIRDCETKGLIDHAPHYNSIFNYLQRVELTPLFKALIEEAASPLKAVENSFAVDASGFGTCSYTRWYDHKYGREVKKQNWLKAHAMVGTRTNVVTSVEVTAGNLHDSPQLVGLVESTAKNFNVAEVSADMAYISHKNLNAIAAVGGTPYIPFKSNNKGEGPEQWQKLWHCFWYRRSEFEQHYHQRSNVESTFSMIKRKLGSTVRSKKFESQVNEVLAKVLCHNLVVLVHEIHELGIAPEFWK
jgi:transposase